ncbi:uncharacterized protein [Palaemon carinicauda]|uniref:uncharacterized protein n=1 Tax=Palaemon carinicauda TaxID=392227 RepID=UPI0035B5D17B
MILLSEKKGASTKVHQGTPLRNENWEEKRKIKKREALRKKISVKWENIISDSSYEDEDVENFYSQLEEEIEKTKTGDLVMVMGDFNSKIGNDRRGYEDVMGEFGLGSDLPIVNTFLFFQVIIENEDGTVQRLEIVSSNEKQGKLRKAVPALPLGFAITCLILNIIPGLEIEPLYLVLASCVDTNQTWKAKRRPYSGICWRVSSQLLLAPIIIGWVWSLHRGVLIVQDALDKKGRAQQQREQEDQGCPA